MKDRTQTLLAEARSYRGSEDAQVLLDSLADALERYQRRVVAHHEFGTLSHEVLAEWDGRACPVCARADTGIV